MSTNAVRCAIPTLVIGTQALGKRVSTAVSAGRRKSTKPMRNIRSMCRDIEWRDGDKGQIPGKRIEPQRPLLDTLCLSLFNSMSPFSRKKVYGGESEAFPL